MALIELEKKKISDLDLENDLTYISDELEGIKR